MAQRQTPSLTMPTRQLRPSIVGGMVPTETDVFIALLHRIEIGMVAGTASGMNGVLET